MNKTISLLTRFQQAYSEINALAKQANEEQSSFRFKINACQSSMKDIQDTIDECIRMDIDNDYPYLLPKTQEKN
tara:strand:+ start:593 stop:814 length:222 start_codon:yes stop_codon:yes gene_type:complete